MSEHDQLICVQGYFTVEQWTGEPGRTQQQDFAATREQQGLAWSKKVNVSTAN